MKRHRRLFAAMLGTALASAALVVPTVAGATPPPPPNQDFAGCPSASEDATVSYCFKYVLENGHVKLGKRNIKITSPIVFRGGARRGNGEYTANSEGGLVPAKESVEGGLVGLTGYKWLDEAIASKSQLQVNATFELAGKPGQLSTFPLTLPVKIHLENPYLGNSCYIGSSTNPLTLNLITGTTTPPAPNKPITGQESSEFEEVAGRPGVLGSTGGTFVDNAFAVPGATGCVFSYGSQHYSIDSLVNAAVGLPAKAGTNEAVFGFSFYITDPETVYPGV